MGQVDKLILLALLGVVGALLLFVVRRLARESNDAAPSTPVERNPTPVEIAVQTPPVPLDEKKPPFAVVTQSEEPVVVLPLPAAIRRKKPRAMKKPAAVAAQTPIVKVLDMLKEKDTLAAAFLLREILAPPVSKRK